MTNNTPTIETVTLSTADMLELVARGGNGAEHVDLPALLERAARELREAEKAVEDLAEPRLSSMRMENGCLDMQIVGPMVERMATAMGGYFASQKAANYLEMRLHDKHETGNVYVLTIQKSGAKTPHQLRQEAELRENEAAAYIERLREALRPFKDVADCYADGDSDTLWAGPLRLHYFRRARAALETTP